MAIAVNKEMQCTLERNIISVWADLVEPHPSINFYLLLLLFEAGWIVWFKYVTLELCYRQEEDDMKTEINQWNQ